ncbi:GPATCH1 [Cervus elaphus hippelaphus]|uniref:GPATCH1 n=1 Tax=Cervus elaphus hippelaphus TaxID=46360 RepID=A0A212DDC8_CEREH|nr:GPATCH1 [Cervus elaphus hippelaphus]
MAALDGDSDEDLVSYGTGLEPLEEGERPKKPIPLQDQTVRDEKGRYKRFHGAFSGGFSAGYFNTVGSKEDPGVKIYGCALPPGGSEGSEDEDDDYLPENVTFAPKDVTPVDFTPKDNVHGLAYKGLDPHQALFGTSGEHFNLFSGGPEETSHLLGDIGVNKGRKLGISGQAFGVGALEEEDDDIYATETLSKYDTVLKDEEPGDGLYGWTAPRQYKSQKESEKDLRYVGKILDGFSLASKPLSSKKIYPPPELPKDYRPVHYFRPVVAATSENSHLLQVLSESAGKPTNDPGTHSRHQLNACKRGELLGETPIQGAPTSVLEFLSQKDKERLREVKQASDLKAAQLRARSLAQSASGSRPQPSSPDVGHCSWHMALSGGTATTGTSNFKPFAKDPEKQKRYEEFLVNMKRGQKDALERCLDPGMTEWERGRERDEFARAALLYASSRSTLSFRFTHAKEEDDSEQNDISDKQSAVKMKMFGKLTRDIFEWHPDKLLCKRFNVPDPYPDSTLVGLPRVKRDKYSVFNFLTIPETASSPVTQAPNEKVSQHRGSDKCVAPFILASSPLILISLLIQGVNKDVDSQTEGEGGRPSMDLFKAIFASSSDEKSSSSEDEQGDSEDDQEGTREADFKSSQETDLIEASSVAQDARQKPEAPLKEKHKKNKEKHRTKKEHRRKKEKVSDFRVCGVRCPSLQE